MKPKQKVMVTGGCGFIGSHTVSALLEAGKEVVVLDNLSNGKLTNLDLSHPNLAFIEGDILEYPLVAELLANCDAVLHLAAITSVPISIEDPLYTNQVNLQGMIHILHAISQINPQIRLVFASSAAVYGEPKQLPCNDELPLSAKPLSPYALQKIHAEDYAALFQQLHHIQSLGMRYFNVYGPRQDERSSYSGVITRFIHAYQEDKVLSVFGKGEQSRDFIHVNDVARANLLAIESEACGVVNIATGCSLTVNALIAAIGQVGGAVPKVTFHPPRAGDITVSYAAVAKAKRILGFNATTQFNEGIKQLLLVNQ
jgi:UDP-glucose 4-epimerase